ncbi:hypothetical protein L1887_18721 [Cichorium endivia]|nr:hypothetical protein L1887_18721 [Cichorium endivia]
MKYFCCVKYKLFMHVRFGVRIGNGIYVAGNLGPEILYVIAGNLRPGRSLATSEMCNTLGHWGILLELIRFVQAGILDKMTKDAQKPNGQDGGDGGSWRRFVVKGHWKPSEDAKLRELVALHGPKNWNKISEQLPGRTGKSCRLRWVNQLDPRIKTTVFSREEDETLMAAHMVFGNQWSHIASFDRPATEARRLRFFFFVWFVSSSFR